MRNALHNRDYRPALLLIALAFVANASSATAQPIGVEPVRLDLSSHPRIGMEMGMDEEMQRGTFSCPCGTKYSGGSGSGLFGSLSFEVPLGPDISSGMKAGFDHQQTTTSNQEDQSILIELPNGNAGPVTMPVKEVGTVTLSFLRFEPYFEYQILHSNFYVQLGGGMSILTSSGLTQTREMTSSSVVLSNGSEINNLTFTNGGRSENVPGSSLNGINHVQFSGLLSAGYNFNFGQVIASPLITYDYPFSTIQSSGNWTITSLSASIRIGFGL